MSTPNKPRNGIDKIAHQLAQIDNLNQALQGMGPADDPKKIKATLKLIRGQALSALREL